MSEQTDLPMSEFKRPLAYIALGLLLAALLVPFFITALGRDDLATGFSIVAGLLALIMAAFSRSDRLGLSVIFALVLLFAFAVVFFIQVRHHNMVDAKARMQQTMVDAREHAVTDFHQPGNDGYLNFKFGMSLGEVAAALNIPPPNGAVPDSCDSLPIAGEYTNAVVHYYAVPIKSVAALRSLGEYSDSSALFFMFKDDKLFRISLRFLNDATCQNHEPIYNAFVAHNGGNARFLYGNRKTFRVDGANDYLIGQLSIDGVFMTIIQNDSPLSVSENYNW